MIEVISTRSGDYYMLYSKASTHPHFIFADVIPCIGDDDVIPRVGDDICHLPRSRHHDGGPFVIHVTGLQDAPAVHMPSTRMGEGFQGQRLLCYVYKLMICTICRRRQCIFVKDISQVMIPIIHF